MEIIRKIKLGVYRRVVVPALVRRLHRREVMNVVFILSELGSWKTERLYLAMLSHPRFSPYILTADSMENPAARPILETYLEGKGYGFARTKEGDSIHDHVRADIIFYQKPYSGVIPESLEMNHNKSSLLCYAHYGFFNIAQRWAVNQELILRSWQVYAENTAVIDELKHLSLNSCSNFIATGMPMQDAFLRYERGSDPWKDRDHARKRIIWAAHHTIPIDGQYLDYSTFLDYSEAMLEIASRYEDSCEFVFKPHPLLRAKLEKFWGKECTDEYFSRWERGGNTQLAEGEYISLMMESDAMIHDCASFTVEYMYTGRPVMYLDNGREHTSGMTAYAAEAYNLHYKASNADDVEKFIDALIAGDDALKAAREAYVKEYLTPGGTCAVENIIDAILR